MDYICRRVTLHSVIDGAKKGSRLAFGKLLGAGVKASKQSQKHSSARTALPQAPLLMARDRTQLTVKHGLYSAVLL